MYLVGFIIRIYHDARSYECYCLPDLDMLRGCIKAQIVTDAGFRLSGKPTHTHTTHTYTNRSN